MRVFHRIDDIKAYSRTMSYVLDFFADSVREFVVAAIPCGFSKRMALQICKYNNCRIYQHGYRHTNRVFDGWCDEFPDSFPVSETRKCIEIGKRRLETLMQREINGYVPPWNNTGMNTVKVLSDLGFEIYSAQKNNTRPFKSKRDIDIDLVSIYTPRIAYRAIEEVLHEVNVVSQCDREIGILYHFQEPSDNDLAEIFRFVKYVESMQRELNPQGDFR